MMAEETNQKTPAQDVIRVKNILLTPSFTDGAQWASTKPKRQPAYVTLSIQHSVAESALSDNLDLTINYSTVCKTIVDAASSRPFATSEDFLQYAMDKCFAEHPQIQSMNMKLVRPKALLQPASSTVAISGRRGMPYRVEEYTINRLERSVIVGVNDCEREQTQSVYFDISWTVDEPVLAANTSFPIRGLFERLFESIADTEYLTLESLVSHVASNVLSFDASISCTTVCAGKPNALSSAEASEVEITRTAADFSITRPALSRPPHDSDFHQVAIALGSNLGDRFANVEYALRLLEKPGKEFGGDAAPFVTIVDTSFLYETEPMYVLDQPKFVNCACLVETNIDPIPLLKFLKEIESAVGRVISYRNGPRAIDLDIVIYDDLVLDTRDAKDRGNLDNLEGQLIIPHPRLHEREFVLRPLADIMPDYLHPTSKRTVRALLKEVVARQSPDTPVMNKVIPFPQTLSEPHVQKDGIVIHRTAGHWSYPAAPSLSTPQKTYIMATLNATPDSFSDGSVNNTISAGLSYTAKAIESGADIIDVGGYSTRPGAAFVSTEEESERVTSMIKAIRSTSLYSTESGDAQRMSYSPLISVDTFRWEVADAAVRAGANCINDVYAFTGPDYPPTEESYEHLVMMRQVASDHALPVILMHSRGEASANKDHSQYAYATDTFGHGAIIEAVRVELGQKVERVVKGKGGLRRWLVIVDPGVGFSKTLEGNVEVLGHAAAIVGPTGHGMKRNPLVGFPILIGASRKSFLGAILSQADGTYQGRETKPTERGWATASAVACAVKQRANVIRVHDVLEMGDVVRVSRWLFE